MAINLSKGQSINLDKQKNNLSRMSMGLGWDTRPATPEGGFFKRMFSSSGGADFDLDGFALLLGANGKLADDKDVIYFGNLRGANGQVEHSGDNLTGEGAGDDADAGSLRPHPGRGLHLQRPRAPSAFWPGGQCLRAGSG